jgi:hypothetical protein
MQSTLDWKVGADGSDSLCGRRAARFQHRQETLPRVPYRLIRDGWWLANESREAERFSMPTRQGRL